MVVALAPLAMVSYVADNGVAAAIHSTAARSGSGSTRSEKAFALLKSAFGPAFSGLAALAMTRVETRV